MIFKPKLTMNTDHEIERAPDYLYFGLRSGIGKASFYRELDLLYVELNFLSQPRVESLNKIESNATL
jgi:hypothetical protein